LACLFSFSQNLILGRRRFGPTRAKNAR
jgi:hypothetical protein